jgi:hypothetical protein
VGGNTGWNARFNASKHQLVRATKPSHGRSDERCEVGTSENDADASSCTDCNRPTSHLEARVTELEALVRNMTKRVSPTGNGSNFNRIETRTCYKCGVLRHLRRPTVGPTAIHTDNPVESRNGLTSHPLQDLAPYKEDSLSGLTSHALPLHSTSEALARSDAAHWKEAIDQENMSCIKYQVWEECTLPKGKHALPCFFVFARKRDGRF